MTEKGEKLNYVYLLQCSDGTLYGGWTNDLEARLEAHNKGTGAKYTRGRTPVTLAYSEVFETKSEATKREWKIKKMTRAKKLQLIKNYGAKSEEEKSISGSDSR